MTIVDVPKFSLRSEAKAMMIPVVTTLVPSMTPTARRKQRGLR